MSRAVGFAICSARGMGEPHDVAPRGSQHLSCVPIFALSLLYPATVSVKSVTGILGYRPAGFINFTLGNWIEVVEVLVVFPKSGQHRLSDCPSFQIVEPLRFETQFYSSFMHQPAHNLIFIDRGNAPIRQGTRRGQRTT